MKTIKDFTWKQGMTVQELMQQYQSLGYQSTELSRVSEVFVKMKKNSAKILLTFTSNMVTSGLRGFFAQVLKKGMADVDNSNTTGIEDGSYDNPYNTIKEGIDNATGDKWIYIREGSQAYQLNNGYLIDLIGEKDLTIWGSGYNGGFNGITATGYPVLKSSADLNERPVHLDDTENIIIMGLDLRGGDQAVVYATGSINLTIDHCIISENKQMPAWGTGGIYIYSFGNDRSAGITITNNTFHDNEMNALSIVAFGDDHFSQYPVIENVYVAGNTFSPNSEGADYETLYPINLYINCGRMSNITIENNNIVGFGSLDSFLDPAAILFKQELTPDPLSQNIIIRNNNITNTIDRGDGIWVEVRSGNSNGLIVSGNNILNVGRGLTLITPGASGEPGSGAGAINSATVSGNTIQNSFHPSHAGLMLISLNDGTLSASVSKNITRNGEAYGVLLDCDSTAELTADLGGGDLESEGYNSIYGNELGGITNEGDGEQTAKYNWWGQADDPASLINGNVDYTPWLTSDPN